MKRILFNDGLLSSIFLIALFSQCGTQKKEIQIKQETALERIGPGGGGATFIPTFSYSNPENFIVRCDMTGSYLTNDGGASYDQINYANGAQAYAFDPKNPNVLYIGATGLNRSTDHGKTWTQIFPKHEDIISEKFKGDHAGYSIATKTSSAYDASAHEVETIRVDPVLEKTIYCSMGSIFFYSTDDGDTWSKEDLHQHIEYLYTNPTTARDELMIFTKTTIFVFNKSAKKITHHDLPKEMSPAFSFTAGTIAKSGKVVMYAIHHDVNQPAEGEFGYSELWTSDDNGIKWNRLLNPLITNEKTGINPSFSNVACAEFDASQVYVVTNRFQEKKDGKLIYWYGALKTSDAGDHWDWVWKGGGGSGQYAVKDGVGPANLKDAWAEKAFGGEYIRLMDVGVSPQDGNVAVVTDWYRTMKTTDGGKSWNEIYSKEQPDGSFISRGLDVTNAYSVHFDPFDKAHLAISYTDIGYHNSFNGGKSWIRSTEGVPAEWHNTCYWVVFDPAVKNKMWSAWSSMHDLPRGKMTRKPDWKKHGKGGVCVSVDGGKSWKPVMEGMGFDSPTTSIVLDPKSPPGKRTLYASVYNKGVFKSVDDGQTWTLKNNGIEANTCAFELTLTTDGSLFLVVSPTPAYKNGKPGREFYSGAVYKSKDGGESWTKLSVTKGLLFPSGIDYDSKNPDKLFLGCWGDLDLADLVGGNVIKTTGGNETLPMEGGIFKSEDGGNSWKQIFDPKQYVYDVTTDPYHDGRLYCNTFNKAAYESDDDGKTWKKLKGYDFHWGQRVVIDENDHEQIYITTFGGSVYHGKPATE